MVRPNELIRSVIHVLKSDDRIPEKANFIGFEPDIDSQSIKLPLIEVSPLTKVQVSESNTDFVRFRTDSNGNNIGRVYETLYKYDIVISAWTAHGSGDSPRDIMDAIRDVLYEYTTSGPDKDLVSPDGKPIDDVWQFKILDGQQTDDISTSPTLRRVENDIRISASEQYITDGQDPVEGFTLDEQTQ